MNALTTQALTMTSLEIATFAGKIHKNVLRDIDTLVETLSSDLSRGLTESTYTDSSGKENRMFILDRDSSYCLVAGYDADARMRIIKRWQELEAAATLAVPTDPVLALAIQAALAADAAKQEIIKTNQRVSAIESAMKTDPIFALPTPPTLSPTQQKRLMINSCVTVTELGRRIGLSPNAMNLRLISSGYQTAQTARNGRLCYSLTQEGDEYGVERYASVHTDGRPNQILWHPTVLANI